jgi:alpha-L-rhamnosidase
MASSHLIPLRDPYFKPQFGDWISAPKCDEVIEFCRDIDLSSSPTKALITIGSLGFFQARINGERISSSYYEGLFSDYEARDPKKEPSLVLGQAHGVYLSCYDVTRFFKNGRNTLTVLLGNGYYQNEERFAEPFYASFGTKKLYFLLRLVYANGSEEMIESDSQTLVRKTAILSGLYRGNRIDFSAPKAPFQRPEIVKAAKASYRFAPIFSDQLCQVITPKLFYSTRGVLRYDCGVNHAGGVALQIQGRKGQEIEIRHAEVLYPDGTLNLETSRYEERDAQGQLLDRIDQISHYTLSGGIDTIEPLFNWYCYRYFEIVGAEGATITHLASYDIHMPLENSGHFSSSETARRVST